MLSKILALLTPAERRRAYLLLCMILIMAFLDTVGVASIMPFMAVLGNPEVVETNRWLAWAYQGLGFAETRNFLFFLGVGAFIALVTSIAFKTLTQYAILRFAHMRAHALSCRLFQGYLGRPYAWFLNRHSAELGKTVLTEVSQVVNGVLLPLMQLLAHGTVVIFLIILLVLVDPFMALNIGAVLGGAYVFIYLTVSRYLSRIGADRIAANTERFRFIQDALGGIKDVKIFGVEGFFVNKFTNPSLRFARHQCNSAALSFFPKYILEAFAFGGILLFILYQIHSGISFQHQLPILVLYAFAGYRLIPAFQQCYTQISHIRFNICALDLLYNDSTDIKMDKMAKKDDNLQLNGISIELKSIKFKYPESSIKILNNLTLKIPEKSTIGFVGSTGSGKTTTIDIILGLLFPCEGTLVVGNSAITAKNAHLWRRSIGYVPQHIYLSDDTIAKNIAFGLPDSEIDMDAVVCAARTAEMHDFVTTSLVHGYDTHIGEKGVRLSGGQRQRIGIARALYHSPQVLIMDEATSSLDNITETHVMDSIRRLKGERTIILVAHRLTTLLECDTIYMLDKGKIIAAGTYQELLNTSDEFKKMAEKASNRHEM